MVLVQWHTLQSSDKVPLNGQARLQSVTDQRKKISNSISFCKKKDTTKYISFFMTLVSLSICHIHLNMLTWTHEGVTDCALYTIPYTIVTTVLWWRFCTTPIPWSHPSPTTNATGRPRIPVRPLPIARFVYSFMDNNKNQYFRESFLFTKWCITDFKRR